MPVCDITCGGLLVFYPACLSLTKRILLLWILVFHRRCGKAFSTQLHVTLGGMLCTCVCCTGAPVPLCLVSGGAGCGLTTSATHTH